MQMIQSIGAVPGRVINRVGAGISFVGSMTSRIMSAATSRFNGWYQQDYAQQTIKPLYERYFKPLDRADYGKWIIVTVIAVLFPIAVYSYTPAGLPLAVCASGILIGIYWYFGSQRKVQQYFNDKAWHHIDEMKKAASAMSRTTQDSSKLLQEQLALDKPEFEQHKDACKNLQEQTKKFVNAVSSADYQIQQTIVNAHLDILVPLVQANNDDKKLVDALKAEIDKVGTDKQDFAAIETHKQKLKGLQTPQALVHQSELSQQINDLVKAVQGPNFTKIKKSYLDYLEGLQKNFSSQLSKHKDDEDDVLDDEKV